MFIKKLVLNGYRSYDHAELVPSTGLNLLLGDNAVGKTNALEAIFLCALGRSHRTSHDAELIGHSLAGGYVGLQASTRTGTRTIEIKLRANEPKQVFVDRSKCERTAQLMGVINVVMFSPEDLSLVKSSPAVRRQFMDMELCQIQPAYYAKAALYNAALRQRNALLREAFAIGGADFEMLDMWNAQAARLGADIMRARRGFMDELSTVAHDMHKRLTGNREELFVSYEPNVDFEGDDAEYAIYDALSKSREDDVRRGFTTRGPHRDDIDIKLADGSVRVYGSQGQQRTAALSLKLSELALMRQALGEPPVLLLDDVLSELDESRQRALTEVAFDCQCFITATSAASLERLAGVTAFNVQNGNISRI